MSALRSRADEEGEVDGEGETGPEFVRQAKIEEGAGVARNGLIGANDVVEEEGAGVAGANDFSGSGFQEMAVARGKRLAAEFAMLDILAGPGHAP